MNRKDFLASIPALSAIPFVTRELITEHNKIILIEPQPIEIVEEVPDHMVIDPGQLTVALMYNGVIFAEALQHEYSRQEGIYEFENFSYPVMHREPELTIRATFRSSAKLMDALHATMIKKYRR